MFTDMLLTVVIFSHKFSQSSTFNFGSVARHKLKSLNIFLLLGAEIGSSRDDIVAFGCPKEGKRSYSYKVSRSFDLVINPLIVGC